MTNYLSPKDAAQQLGVSSKTIIRAARRGELQAIQIGRQWRVLLNVPAAGQTITPTELMRG